MATSSPAPSNGSAAPRRASGRVRKQTEHFAPSPAASAPKRKRDAAGDAAEEIDEDDEDEDEDEEESEEEEIEEQRKPARKSRPGVARKPAAKKPKTNGTTLPFRSSMAPPKRKAPKKVRLDSQAVKDAGGLYASVLGSDEPIEQIIADWLKRYEEKNSAALAEVVNFALQCIGGDLQVDEHAIEDPDGATNKIDDLREEYQATKPTDYPLIVKGQKATAIRNGLALFFQTLVETISANGMLANDPALIEHLHIWFSTMSSAPNRPFRHTATFISLNITTALCKCAHENAKGLADDRRHAETEAAKPRANKARVKQLEDKSKAKQQAQEMFDSLLKDWFDTVFVHRYRDVDPVIRQESIAALGEWTSLHPDVFFDGAHLRYFGWVLGDHNANTRCEVVKQLLKLYNTKTMLGGLRTFTEKFRPRMVEIATNDADIHVRIPCIELLDRLRANGMLEPDDIDNVGRLIFDTDARVRKAVAAFFAANVVDSYDSKIDELGGLESLQDTLPEPGEDTYDTLRLEWLKLKALAEMLGAYDYDEELPSQISRSRGEGAYLLNISSTGSRFMLATEMLYDKIEEVQSWQTIAGYLLFDHSTRKKNGARKDALAQLKQECALTDKEEMILLEMLNASVKRFLTTIADKLDAKAKPGKKERQDLINEQESAAHGLATLIPQLLKKFGDTPSTAASVLRMESVLNLPSLRDLRQDSATYAALLDDVRKQFMSHSTDEVLAPASNAILHAKSYGELDDLTEEKLNKLWEDVVSNFSELVNVKTLTVRGASQSEEMVALSNNLLRICRLGHVSDSTGPLEDDSVKATVKSTQETYSGAIDFIIALVKRGQPSPGPAPDEEEAALEDQISILAAETALFYFRWKIRAVIAAVTEATSTGYPENDLYQLAVRRDQHVDALKAVVESRKARENISASLTGCILDIFTSAAVVKEIERRPNVSDDFTVLACEFDEPYEKLILKVFSAHEKNFARLGGKKLETKSAAGLDADLDDEEIHEDPLSDSDSDADEAASAEQPTHKVLATLLAERDLCTLTGKIIQAVFAGVLAEKAVRKRLERNKGRLGPNFRECVAYLDEKRGQGKGKKNGGGKGKKQSAAVATEKTRTTGQGKKSAKSSALVLDDEEVEDEIEDDEDEEGRLAEQGLDDRPAADLEDPEEGEGGNGNVGGGDEDMESVLGD